MLAFALGILLGGTLLFRLHGAIWLPMALAAWFVWWLAWRTQNHFATFLLLLSFLFFGVGRYHAHWHCYSVNDVALFDFADGEGLPVAARCQLLTIPEGSPLPPSDPLSTLPKGVESSFYANVTGIRNGQSWESATGRVVVRVDGHVLGYSIGDTVEVFGTLGMIRGPMNPGERDRRVSERNRRTLCRLNIPHPDCIHKITSAGTNPFSVLGRMRSGGLALLDEHVGSPRSDLAGALLLGARDRLGQERIDRFFHTGTIHLLAISGLHVGILAWGFFFLAKRTSARQVILLLLMFGAVVYCHLTGLRAPVLRAAVLIQVICLSQLWRRDLSAFNALSAAAILVLIHRPGALFLPGAQLSFLAVGALIWLSENYVVPQTAPIENLVMESRSVIWRFANSVWTKTKQLGLAGAVIWVVTLPLVMHWFHLCSPVSLFLNIVLTVPITLGLLSGFGVLVSGATIRPLAAICGQICDGCLAFVESVVGFSHEIPCAYFWICGSSSVWCALFYVVLAGLFLTPRIRFTKRMALAWFALWLTLPLAAQAVSLAAPSSPLRCTFLSVGHGTCAVLEMPDNRVVIYDAGRMGVPQFGVSIVSEFLWSRGISHVDAVVISHADADHYNLVPELSRRFSIGEVLVTSRMFAKRNANLSPGVEALHVAIQSANIPVRHLRTNDVLRFADASARVLHPLSGGVRGSDNANSIVLEIDYQGRFILLPGDLESPGLDDVMAEMPRDIDLVMAPHHGSLRSEPEAFTEWCSPEFVVISAGRDKKRARVTQAFENNGAQVFHTAYDGAITATVRDGQIAVVSFLRDD